MNEFLKKQAKAGFEVYQIWLSYYLATTSDYDPVEYNFKTRATLSSFMKNKNYKNCLTLANRLSYNEIDSKRFFYYIFTNKKRTQLEAINTQSNINEYLDFNINLYDIPARNAKQTKAAIEESGKSISDVVDGVPIPLVWYHRGFIDLDVCGFLLEYIKAPPISDHPFLGNEYDNVIKFYNIFKYLFISNK